MQGSEAHKVDYTRVRIPARRLTIFFIKMTFSETKTLHPQLSDVAFEKYLLLCEGKTVKFAFEIAYLNTDKVGSQHLHSSYLCEIQNRFNLWKEPNNNIVKPLTLF